jgi:hypothetical protein
MYSNSFPVIEKCMKKHAMRLQHNHRLTFWHIKWEKKIQDNTVVQILSLADAHKTENTSTILKSRLMFYSIIPQIYQYIIYFIHFHLIVT